MSKKEKRMNNFDDAFSVAQADYVTEENLDDTDVESEEMQEDKVTSDAGLQENVQAADVAETAALAAQEADSKLQEVLQENELLRQENAKMQELLSEINTKNKEMVIKESVPELPQLDFSALSFADEAQKKEAAEKYSQDMIEYAKQAILKDIAPFVEQAKKGQLEAEKTELMAALKDVPELDGIGDMSVQLDRIIANNRVFQNDDIPLSDKYITAYAIAKGVEAMNNPYKPPTVDELMSMYNSNPEFKEAIEKQRLAEIKKQTQDIPVLSGSSGIGNVAPTLPGKPKNWDEALANAKKREYLM